MWEEQYDRQMLLSIPKRVAGMLRNMLLDLRGKEVKTLH